MFLRCTKVVWSWHTMQFKTKEWRRVWVGKLMFRHYRPQVLLTLYILPEHCKWLNLRNHQESETRRCRDSVYCYGCCSASCCLTLLRIYFTLRSLIRNIDLLLRIIDANRITRKQRGGVVSIQAHKPNNEEISINLLLQ